MKIDKEIYERVSDITGTDYEAIKNNDTNEDKVIIYDNEIIESMLQNLIIEIDSLQEKIEDIEEDMSENCIRKDTSSQYGVRDSWFH